MKKQEITQKQIECHEALQKELNLNVDIAYCKCFKTVEECLIFFREILEIKDEYNAKGEN